jgi:2-phosphosulfolactate phosphatase
LVASFVVAEATLRRIQKMQPEMVTFIITGSLAPTGAAEDVALADYLTARLSGQPANPAEYLGWCHKWDPRRVTVDSAQLQNLYADLECCLQIDRFDFAMRVRRQANLWIMEAD